MKVDKHILAIDFIVIVGTLASFVFLFGYTSPLVISPIDDLTTSNNSVLFEFEKANVVLIDDNIEFSSPEKVRFEDNLVITFKPGIYYWKAEGIVQSEVRKLTIESDVSLKLRKSGDRYEVVNAGNARLNVDVFNNNSFTGKVVLDVDESEEVSGTKFIGSLLGGKDE